MILLISPCKVSADEISQTDRIISYGRNLIGSTDYDGYCQKFVRLCYESAGIYSSTYGIYTAMNAYETWCVSDSRDNIPIGACLYFNTSEYGHVAIYTGNNQMIHGVGIVKEEQISDYYWNLFLGWGYQAGIEPTGIIYESETETAYPSVPYVNAYSIDNQVTVNWSSYAENTSYYNLNVYNKDSGTAVFTQDYSSDIYSSEVTLPAGNYYASVKAVNEDYSNCCSYSNYFNFTVSDAVSGDMNHNGMLDISDIVMLSQYLIYDTELDARTFKCADFNNDGVVDILDFVTMKKFLVESEY
jgi:hypothetical protein